VRRSPSEWRHCRLPGRTDVLAADHLPDREQKDAQIQPEALVIHIPDIKPELFLPGDGIAAIDLGPATEARLHIVAASLLPGIQRQVLHQQRPWADETHLTAEDIDQLGQLVDRGDPQPAAERREPLGIGEQRAAGVTGVGHGAELQQPERPIAVTGTLLPKENRGSEAPTHQEGYQHKQR